MKANCLHVNHGNTQVIPGFSRFQHGLKSTRAGAFLFTLMFAALLFTQTLTAQNLGDYRSLQTGNWVSPTTWQYYDGTTWVAATNYPGELNIIPPSYAVTILQNHTVYMNQITGTVGDSTPYLFNNLAIYGELFLNGVNNAIVNFVLKAQNIMVYVTGPTTTGTITFNNKGYLYLPQNGNLLFEDPTRTTYLGGSCSNNMEIYFRPCPIPYAVCVGTGNSIYYTFAGLMAAGGSLFVAVDVSTAVGGQIELCYGEDLYINATSTGQAANTSLYSWIIKDPVTQATVYGPVSVTYPNINLGPVPGLNPGTYVAVLTATDNFQPTCPHSNSDSVYVYVEEAPDAPISGGDQLLCPNASVNLTVTTNPANLTVNWYTASTGGTPVYTGYTYTVSTPGTWYAEAVSPLSNCPSARTAVTAYLDNEAPVFTACPINPIELGCNPAALPDANMALTDAGTPTDNYNVASVIATAGNLLQNGCYYTQTWTVTAYDDCNNTGVCSVTYNWKIDTQLPVISTQAISNTDLGCNPTVVAPVFTGLDNCDGAFTPVVTTAGASNIGCNYSQTWTANYTDACGNIAVPVSITYTWKVDTQAPVISTLATSGNLGCNPTVVAPVFTGLDNCDGVFTPNVATAGPVATGCNYTQTWTATYTDACNNAATPVSITYTWKVDTEKPVLATTAVSGDLGCNPTVAAPIFTGTDNCDGTITPVVTSSGAANTGGCLWSQTWTANYTDLCGNIADPVSITYTWKVDTQAPVISTVATSGNLGCNPTVVAPVFTGLDNCDGVFTPNVATLGPVATGCNYTQTWTATYTDACGNPATPVAITYTWKVDTEKPVLATSAVSGDLGCNPTVAAPIFTGTDNCDGTITPVVTSSGAANTGGCLWSQTWTANYTDLCGNIADPISITYTWKVDTEAPVISTVATSGNLGCNPTVVAPVFTGLDNCDGIFTPSVATLGPVATGCNYTQTWTADYTDACGNPATQVSITYTWKVDTELPVISTTATNNEYFGCNPQITPPAFTGLDNCDGQFSPVVTTAGPVANGCNYSQTWTANYTDACGNIAIPVSIIYTWKVDTEAPVISTLATSGNLGCNPTVVAPVFTGLDNCDGVFTPSVVTNGPVATGCNYTQTWTA
jgi:hypothetical protein